MDALKKYIKVLKEQDEIESDLKKSVYVRCNKRINKPLLNIEICLKCKYKDRCLEFAEAKFKKPPNRQKQKRRTRRRRVN